MTISKTIAAVIAIAFLCMMTCKETTTEPTLTESEKLLLAANEISGWGYDPAHTPPEGTATTEQGLYALIDGGANEYIDRGWISAACKSYTDGNIIFNLQIYEQENSDSALLVFKKMDSTNTEGEIVPIGDTAAIDSSSLFDLTLLISAQEFFIQIRSYYSKETTYKKALISFGQKVVSKIGRE